VIVRIMAPSARISGHRRRGRAAALSALLLGATLAPRPAVAADPAPPSGAAERLARARDLFDKGYALLRAGDCEGALRLFQLSLAEAPSSSSTMNAAYCLNELKRPGEALELYEDLLITAAELSEGDKAVIAAAVAKLRKKVGSIELSANVDGQVTVDGRERGKLPRDAPIRVAEGEHVVRIRKEGHEIFERKVDVSAGATVAVDATLKPLAPPPAGGGLSPPPPRPYPFVSAFGGFAITNSLGSTAEIIRCPVPCSPATGALLGIRSGYRFGPGVALELSFGYLSVASTFSSSMELPFKDKNIDAMVHFDFKDELRVRGPFLGMGVSYWIELGSRFGLIGRATVGLLSAQTIDPITGTAKTDGDPVPVLVAGRSQVLLSQPAFIMPEVGVEARWGGLRVGALLGFVFLTSEGPIFNHDEVGLETRMCTDTTPPGSVGCVPNQSALSGERAYGSFMLWVPQVAVGYSF
jgi:hypothetical protein